MNWRRPIDQWFIAEVLPHAVQYRAYARRLSANDEEAQDLVQDAYAQLLSAEDFARIENPKAFMLRVLHNIAASKARRAKIVAIQNIPDLDTLGRADPSPDAHRQLQARQELAALEAAIRALPTRCRQVVTLRKVYELSPSEIAARLSISVSTVETQLSKGMRLIARRLAEITPLESEEGRQGRWTAVPKDRA